MEKTDPLAQLKDIHLPDPVGWWPLAWGWWVLLVIILLAIAVAIYSWRRNQARNAYRDLALAELQLAKQALDQDSDTAHYLQQVSIILRRAAMTGGAHHYQTDLKGETWLQWLDAQCPATSNGFTQGVGRALLTGPYEANPEADIASLHHLVKLWLQQHRNRWQKEARPQRKSSGELRENSDA